MKHVVVRQVDMFRWDVAEADRESDVLFSGDRIRGEHFARQLCAEEGGTVTVVGPHGTQLAEYPVKPYTRKIRPYADPPRRRRA